MEILESGLIDQSVYPDLDHPPDHLDTPEAKADYLSRICAAWDYDITPTRETFVLLARWREIFDRFPILTSPSYAAFRTIFGWPALSGGSVLEADYERYDRLDGRRSDPCQLMV